jgi:hypothetical protein
MRRRLAAALLASLALAASGASPAAAMKKQRPLRSTELPRPRDGNIAVQEELDAARRAGTVAAYDMFLSRHGDHALAAAARQEREHLLVSTRR